MHRSVQHDSSTDINIKVKICAIEYEHCITGHLPLFKMLSSKSNSTVIPRLTSDPANKFFS